MNGIGTEDVAQGYSTHEGTVSSNGKSEREIPLLTAQAIKQLEDEDVIVFHRNLAPIKAWRLDWRRFDLLRQRAGLTPPEVAALEKNERAVIRTQESITSGRKYNPYLLDA